MQVLRGGDRNTEVTLVLKNFMRSAQTDRTESIQQRKWQAVPAGYDMCSNFCQLFFVQDNKPQGNN